jgi:hypothetical protein
VTSRFECGALAKGFARTGLIVALLAFLVRELRPFFADKPFEIGEWDLPENVGWTDALAGYREIAAVAVDFD